MQLVHSPQHHRHATRPELPGHQAGYLEIPERVDAILRSVKQARLGPIIPAQDHGLAPILDVHGGDLIDFLQRACAQLSATTTEAPLLIPDAYFAVRGQRHRPATLRWLAGYYAIDRDCPLLPGTWEAAYWSAQAALTAADLVRNGQPAAYALCRPPGHHAAADQYGGYCYLNNAAIAARALRTNGAGRVAIVDIDYHHGNGTQEIFYADPTVLTCSLHADPDGDYPYFWGGSGEVGAGVGIGYNRNWPLPPGTTDLAYLAALDEALHAVRSFAPDVLLISAGFDLMAGDPSPEAGGFAVTPAGLSEIGRRLAALCLPTVIVQEGGYRLDRLGSYAVTLLLPFAEP